MVDHDCDDDDIYFDYSTEFRCVIISIVRVPCYYWFILSIGFFAIGAIDPLRGSCFTFSVSSVSRFILYSMLFIMFKCVSTIRSCFVPCYLGVRLSPEGHTSLGTHLRVHQHKFPRTNVLH